MLEKTEGVIKIEQSRDTGNIEHNKQNKDKQNKTKNTSWKTKKMRNMDPTRTRG